VTKRTQGWGGRWPVLYSADRSVMAFNSGARVSKVARRD
jgi:hypothetical protein